MSDTEENNPVVPEAKVVARKRSRFSFVWIIPLVAALAGVWIAVTTIRNQGPVITLVFQSAEALEANKTVIRYNGVEVGEISSIRLSDDYQSVIATAKMSPKTEEFLKKDTKFWIVKPQISGANVSGLSTLISGAYIGMEIGKAPESERHFVALDDPPLEVEGITGRFFTLKTPELGSLNKGTPIYFRRLQAGQVASYALDPSGKFLNVKIFVQAPYDQYVTPDTKFWQASGVNLSLTANGLQVHTESLLSILVGGIAFDTPAPDASEQPAEANTVFTLHKDRQEAFRLAAKNPFNLTLIFTESLRGLTVGAPVELEGIPIGEVTRINAKFDSKTYQFSAPVTIELDPARYGVDVFNAPASASTGDIAAHQRRGLESLVAHGLRAQLKTGSLISGSQYVALDFFPDAKPVTLDWSQDPVQLPTVSGQMEMLEASASSIIKKIDQMPFQELGENLNKTIAGVQGTLTNTDQLLQNANRLVAPDSVLDAQLNVMLQQAGGAANAFRVLADYLERHPEALIRGKTGDPKK
jgi:paraquat-inducible protein B